MTCRVTTHQDDTCAPKTPSRCAVAEDHSSRVAGKHGALNNGGRRRGSVPGSGHPRRADCGRRCGAAIEVASGHVSGGMKREGLKELGDVLDEGRAGLIVVYATNTADQIAANVKAANRMVSKATNMAADVLARDIKEADAQTAGSAA